jgi:hypothetical protein
MRELRHEARYCTNPNRRYRADAVAPEIVCHGAALGARISTEGAIIVGDLLFEWIFVAHMSPLS